MRAVSSRTLPAALRSFSFAQRKNHHHHHHPRLFQTSSVRRQEEYSDPKAHRNFYKSHGRAIAKALTLAFFSFQLFYWSWITLETEQMKDRKSYEIRSLEGEVRLLEEGKKSHRPVEQTEELVAGGKRMLEEVKK